MSNINTNGINTNYPVPGVNNSTQGFRDNFNSIKTNLNAAYDELTDLQDKVVVKSALSGSALDNDMANTLISNAAVRGFRSPTYNLGSSIPATLVVDVSLGDIQYGTITQNTSVSFAGWSPTGTKSNVQLYLTIANSSAYIQFPDSFYDASNVITTGTKAGIYNLENFVGTYANGVAFDYNPTTNVTSTTITNKVGIPIGQTELQYNISSIDCGTTIDVEPMNTGTVNKVITRTPLAVGSVGDVEGSICVDGSYAYICTNSYGNAKLAVTGVSGTGSTATLTFAAQPLPPFKGGATITVATVTPTGYNGTRTVTACTTTTVSYSNATTGSTGFVSGLGSITGPRVIWGRMSISAVPT